MKRFGLKERVREHLRRGGQIGRTEAGHGLYRSIARGLRLPQDDPVTDGFSIVPANGGRECRQEFVRIVDQALGCASAEGYQIITHESSRDFLGWDKAIFIRNE